MTTSEILSEKLGQWRQPAAIIRHRLGGDHCAWRRIDLGQDVAGSARRSRIGPEQAGTSLSKSVPLSDQYSLTLQNGYNLIQQVVVLALASSAIPGAQLRDRPVREVEHRRHRHQLRRRTELVDRGRQMAAQGRRRAKAA